MTLAVWIERHGLRRPDAPALADGDRIHADWATFAARAAGGASGLRDQFGLRLESTRGPVEVHVIDAVRQPTEN